MKLYLFKNVLFLGIIIFFGVYFLKVYKNYDKFNFLSYSQKVLLNKYLLPYRYISQQDQKIRYLQKSLDSQAKNAYVDKNLELLLPELNFKKSAVDIPTRKTKFKLSNRKTLTKYKLVEGFYYGINNFFPGSGYLDFHNERLFIVSSRGLIAFKENLENDKKSFRQIENNIEDFIGIDQYKKDQWYSIKDLLIFRDKIYISFTEEIKEDCWNTSIIYGNINTKFIKFQKLFSPNKCIFSEKSLDNEFNAHQSGGRIIPLDDNKLLLSVGDYRSRYLAQDKASINGKIILIDIFTKNYEIISMGHRNPQGLYFDKKNQIILETEHGPMGGDEINLIEIGNMNLKKEIQNYGWPVVSKGEHYGGKNENNKKKYLKYPLYKSHKKYGFIEPIKSFVPSIGVSEIVRIKPNIYVFSTLKDKAIYFMELNKKRQIENIFRLEVYERIRDLKYKNNKLYMFMEDTASIGVLNLN